MSFTQEKQTFSLIEFRLLSTSPNNNIADTSFLYFLQNKQEKGSKCIPISSAKTNARAAKCK